MYRLIYLLFPFLLFACGSAENTSESNSYHQETNKQHLEEAAPSEESSESADATFANFSRVVSSSAAEVIDIPGKKFIREANLKFRVSDVHSSTITIEKIIRKNEGFVINTNLQSNINYTETTPISADSSLETMYYTVTNDIILRVPNNQLDASLKELSKEIDYLDYRTITANDVSISIKEKELYQSANQKHSERLEKTIDKNGKKLRSTLEAEEALYSNELSKNASKIERLKLEDKIEYSTIYISIYQRRGVLRQMIENHKNIEEYQPSFGKRASEALSHGWDGLKSICIGLMTIWPLLILTIGIVLGARHYSNRFSKQ